MKYNDSNKPLIEGFGFDGEFVHNNRWDNTTDEGRAIWLERNDLSFYTEFADAQFEDLQRDVLACLAEITPVII
jgi:hypothetical protein